MLEAWIGAVVAKTVAEYAENKSGYRHLQTGVGWDTWQSIFGHAKPEEWGHILGSLVRFANCETRDGDLVEMMFSLAGQEDKYAGQPGASVACSDVRSGSADFSELVVRMRSVFRRLTEWMEALTHWRVHWMSQIVPINNQPTEEQRELVQLGLMQAGYSGMSEQSKEWWKFRHEALAAEYAGKPEWRLVGKAQSFGNYGELRQPDVDELTIHWWPLLTRYRWTDRDMCGLLRQVVPHPEAYPLRDEKEFADYRKKALGLIKGKGPRDKSAPDGKPMGWRVALAMVGKLSE